jgi:hypothetical protein
MALCCLQAFDTIEEVGDKAERGVVEAEAGT